MSKNHFITGLRIILAALMIAPQPIWANPSGGTVVSGAANITSSGNTLTVQQLSDLAILNWDDFSNNAGELTKFVQPSALSAALNRVTGANPSALYGTLQANGRIYLINPNGITVGPSGVINAQSFVASSLDVGDSAFLAEGDLLFSGSSLAGVSNAGQINALGGDILLVAHTVQNTGSLNASGTAGMAAGSQVLFTASGNQRVFVQAGSGSSAVGVDQKGQIQAATSELAAAGGNVYALAVNNEGTVNASGVSNVGGRIFLTADGGAVSTSEQLSAAGQGGQVAVTGGQISLGGDVTSNEGSQTYNGPVQLIADAALISNGGDIQFSNDVDGANSLALDVGAGRVRYDGGVGQNTALTALSVTGNTDIEGGAVTTSGDQTYNGALVANPNTVLSSNSGKLTFNGPVNTGFNLTTNSAQHTTFRGAVSVGSSLTSNITSSAGSIDLWSPSIVSGGDQTYNGPIFVGQALALNSLFGNLTFNGKINGIHSTPNQGVEANMMTSSAWNTNFNGPVTMGTLTSNITGPGAVNFYTGAVTTFYNQTYNGPVNAQVDTVLRSSDGNLIFNGPVNAAFSLTTNSTGDTDFNGPVFVGNSLTSNASFGTINLRGGSIISGGDQTYNRPLKLGADNSLSSLYGNLNFDGTVDGAYALTTKSAWNTNFNQAVGAATPLASLTSNIITPGQADIIGGPGHVNINGGSLITSGDQTYNGPVYAQPDTVLTSNSGNLNFNGPVNAGNSLTTNSAENTTFDGAVFAGNSLTSNITSSGGEIKLNGGSVISGGDQTYNGPLFLGQPLTLNSLFGNLNFNGDINGVFSGANSQIENPMTTYSAWNTTFNGAVSLGHLSSNITSSDGAINMNAGLIHTYYNQTYNGTLRLGRDSRLISREAVLSFNGTVDGGYNLEVLSGLPGTVTFNGRVGSITPLASLIAGGGWRTNLNGGSITTVNDLRLHGATWLGSDNTLTSTAGNVSFRSRVDGGYALTTNSHLNTSFEGHVGSNIPLESLTANITGPGGIFLNGNTVTTTGTQTYNGPLTP